MHSPASLDFKTATFALWQKRKWILFTGTIFAFVAMVWSLVVPPTYRAEATFIAVSRSPGGLSDLLSGMRGTFAGGALLALTQKHDEDKFVLILESRTLTEAVIRGAGLLTVLLNESQQADPYAMELAVQKFHKQVDFERRRDGSFRIAAAFKTRELAVKVVNQILLELQNFLNRSFLTLAKKNRLFVEQRLNTTGQELQQAEESFRSFQQTHGVIALDAQVELSMRTIAEIEAALVQKDIEINSLKGMSTAENPDLDRLIAEKRALMGKRAKLLGEDSPKSAIKKNGGSFSLTMQQTPEIGLEYLRLKREVLIKEKTFELLTAQYEMAKIEEVKDDIAFQILDPPALPKYRFSPKRKLMTLVGALIGFVSAVAIVLTQERYPLMGVVASLRKNNHGFGRAEK